MTLQLLHSELPFIWGKFDFLFYQCNMRAQTMFEFWINCNSSQCSHQRTERPFQGEYPPPPTSFTPLPPPPRPPSTYVKHPIKSFKLFNWRIWLYIAKLTHFSFSYVGFFKLGSGLTWHGFQHQCTSSTVPTLHRLSDDSEKAHIKCRLCLELIQTPQPFRFLSWNF